LRTNVEQYTDTQKAMNSLDMIEPVHYAIVHD